MFVSRLASMSIYILIKKCDEPKKGAQFFTRTSLEHPVTCNNTRLLKQTLELGKSGLDCGRFRNIRLCNKIKLHSELCKSRQSNRLNFAVLLFSNRSKTTSKCVRTPVTHSDPPRVPLFCSYYILTSSATYY